MRVTLITGWDDNRLIGNGSGLPWHISEDLKVFKNRTKGQVIIMGLRTYNGLPKKPLPDRVNVVIMTEEEFHDFIIPKEGHVVVPFYGVKEGIKMAQRLWPDKEIFICGGRSIYQQALEQDLVERMLISIIPGEHEGDVYFPAFPGLWNRTIIEEYDEFKVEEWTKDQK